MGIGPTALRLYEGLLADGYLQSGLSVCELGSQAFMPADYRGKLATVSNRDRDARKFYESLGMSYMSIDINGERNAVRLNLNKAKSSDIGQQFDIVTNHGTTEHVFDQENCFRLIHDLTIDGGLMIHVVPTTQGYRRHGLYNYDSLFFDELSHTNQYVLIRRYEEEDRFGMLAVVVLKRIGDYPFVVPIQSVYGAMVP
jgi:hypothetical protein